MNFLYRRLQAAELLAGKLEKSRLLLIGCPTLLYFVFRYVLTRRKLMWNDELYTYYIARLPTMADVLAALRAGGEQIPPFFYALTRASLALFGATNFALRLPEMIGFWVMSLCLFVFVARRTSNFYALAAAIFPLLTDAYYYADEARPYGLVLGFGALALLCWQSATTDHDHPRRFSLPALALSLAAALSSHYYGVLIILPLALGEAARTLTRRRVDAPVWAAFGLAATPLVWHLPLIRQARAYSGAFWSPPRWVNIPDFYAHILSPAVLPLAAMLSLAAIYAAVFRNNPRAPNRVAPFSPPAHEVVAACGFSVLPFICVALAKLATGAFTDRYAIPAVIGLGVLVAFSAAKMFDNRALMAAALAACFGGWFLFTEARALIDPSSKWVDPTTAGLPASVKLLQSEPERSLPIVAADPHTLVVFSHYAPPEVSSRMVYLADPAIALKRLGQNSVERGMVDLVRPWFRMNVADYQSFIAEHPRFLLYGNFGRAGFMNWILPELQADNMRVDFRGRSGENLFFLISRGEHAVEYSPASGAESRTAKSE